MDNKHEPPSGDPQESWPTQEIGPSSGQPGPGNWGRPSTQPGYGPGQGWSQRRHGSAVWWGAGLALVLLLAGGGAAAAELTSSPSPAPAALSGQAAQLNALLNSSSPDGSGTTLSTTTSSSTATRPCLNRAKKLKAAGHPVAARAVLRLCGHALRRLRLLGGIHGQFTFETKSGPRTIAYERGVIESISGSNVVVQAKDGTTWTWVLGSSTTIRRGGQKSAASALSDGQHVFAGGSVISGGYDAKLIVVKPSSGSSSPTPTPSPATGS
jgi:hypothetical protein